MDRKGQIPAGSLPWPGCGNWQAPSPRRAMWGSRGAGVDSTGKTMLFPFVHELTMDENSHPNHETAPRESADNHI